MLKTKMTVAAGALLMGLAFSGASAQAGNWVVTTGNGPAGYAAPQHLIHQVHKVHNPYGCRMSRKEVRRSLRHKGFRKIEFVRDRGDRYVFFARNHHRQKVRLVVSAYHGEILRYKVRGRWR
ncbi:MULTISPECIES: hypothetical protein [Pseudovibrio]|uniref:hypothetical protein n=1 Tax=Stappiaceae TaxID=2821832 RepID=UPI002366A714|nr:MULTISPECIES: hypothetical protein [Pseudovibrio]MDD7911849.1 hypothetical protein [Pseudovibrio exalbescens]MDX5594702.1 hypothetical protein [Pseudovibrio sp. SPO723]